MFVVAELLTNIDIMSVILLSKISLTVFVAHVPILLVKKYTLQMLYTANVTVFTYLV